MAQTLQGDRVNRFTISSTTNHTDESFEGNMDVSSLSSVSVLSRKKNVRIYARNAISGAWSVLAVVGPTASTVEGTGTKHHRDTTLNTTDYDRISVVTVDGADADVRVVHSSVLPSAILSRGQAASYTTEHELTSLAAGVAQTIDNVSGMPIVQVFEQTTAAAASTALSYTGSDQSFVVPAGVTSITAKLWGAGGGGGHGVSGNPPQAVAGGYTTGDISVTPGETLTLVVGQGGGYTSAGNTFTPATYGGGGRGYVGGHNGAGGGGGGLAGIFRGSVSQSNALLIAAGSTGAWGYTTIPAQLGSGLIHGYAGGLIAVTPHGGQAEPANNPGGPGTQIQGGKAGTDPHVPNGTAGTALQGGSGGHASSGGGAGYFGGGGGTHHGPGGGGSAFLGTATNASTIASTGVSPPNASDSDYVAGVGVGGDQGVTIGSNPAGYGGNALIVLSYSSGPATLTDKTHNYTVTHDSSTNQLSVTSASPVDTIKVRIATA